MELEVGGVDDYELLQPGEGEVVEGGQVEQLCHVRVLDSREPGHWTVGVLDSNEPVHCTVGDLYSTGPEQSAFNDFP